MILNAGGHNVANAIPNDFLWENEDATKSVQVLDIELDLSNYDIIYVVAKERNDVNNYCTTILLLGDGLTEHTITMYPSSNSFCRNVTVNDTGLHIGNAKRYCYPSDGQTTSDFDLRYLIPYRIYGSRRAGA